MMYEEAADRVGVPSQLREEVIARVRREHGARISDELADAMHEVVMSHLAQDGTRDGV